MKSDLKKRIQKTQADARARLAKREVMRFRCTENDILRLNDFANKSGLPVGTLIRKWVLERLEQESQTDFSSPETNKLEQFRLSTFRTEISKEMQSLDKRLKLIEKFMQRSR